MSPSRKAALLSGLVYPGIGHFLLKKYWLGSLIITLFSSALYIVLSHTLKRAELITQKILSGAIPPTLEEITKAISQQPTGDNAQLISLASYALVIVWAVALCHAYRLGKLSTRHHNELDSPEKGN